MLSKYTRPQLPLLMERLREKRRFIQILFGPRQVGKTTLVQQMLEKIASPSIFVSADAETNTSGIWISQHWEKARLQLKSKKLSEIVLVFDEIQKIHNWSEHVKKEWDKDSRDKLPVKIVLLGSSSLLIQKGLTESLAGRFELMRIPHWSFPEMQTAFGLSLDEYIFFGGYPGAVDLIKNESRWKQYIRDALIEPAITKDVLLITRIDKPALLRQIFQLGTIYSGKIFSYTKLLGQLQDAGNTTTLAHYLELLNTAGLLTGLQKFSGKEVKTRSSIPKFQTYNTALISAYTAQTLAETRATPEVWGHYVESAVGAHLVNNAPLYGYTVTYWREGNYEVDFILTKDTCTIALEVKSGRTPTTLSGTALFTKRFKPDKSLLIGHNGISIQEFLSASPRHLF